MDRATSNRLCLEPQASIQRPSWALLVHPELQPEEAASSRKSLRLLYCPSADAPTLVLLNYLKVSKAQSIRFRSQSQQANRVRLHQDDQVLKLDPATDEAIWIPGDASRSEVTAHVATIEPLTEGTLFISCGSERKSHCRLTT